MPPSATPFNLYQMKLELCVQTKRMPMFFGWREKQVGCLLFSRTQIYNSRSNYMKYWTVIVQCTVFVYWSGCLRKINSIFKCSRNPLLVHMSLYWVNVCLCSKGLIWLLLNVLEIQFNSVWINVTKKWRMDTYTHFVFLLILDPEHAQYVLMWNDDVFLIGLFNLIKRLVPY